MPSKAARTSPVEHVGVFGGDPVALFGDLGGRPIDGCALLKPRDVVADKAERNVEVLDPVFVGGIEAVAGREVEPGILRFLPGREPFRAVRMLGDGRQRLVDRSGLQRVDDAELDGELGEFLQLIVGLEQVDLDALHHLGDGLIGNGRELLLHEAEEIEIGGIAEVQELEVILPRLVEELDRSVVGLHQRVGIVETDAAGDPFERHDLRQLLEIERFQVGDVGAHLLVPVGEQTNPNSGNNGRRAAGTAVRGRGSGPAPPRPGSCKRSRCGYDSRRRSPAAPDSGGCCTGPGI